MTTVTASVSMWVPSDAPAIANLHAHGGNISVIVENELIVRGNLPAASRDVRQKMGM